MNFKKGTIVCHSVAPQWGSGRVTTVTPEKLTIEFSDGEIRKIVAAHFLSLQPADPATFTLPAAKTSAAKPLRKTTKKITPKLAKQSVSPT